METFRFARHLFIIFIFVLFSFIFDPNKIFSYAMPKNDGNILNTNQLEPASSGILCHQPLAIVSSKNLTLYTSNCEFVLIELIKPTCPHSLRLMPIFVNLANEYYNANKNIVVAKGDAFNDQNFSIYFNIPGYPLIYFIHNQTKQMYPGSHSKEPLNKWVLETIQKMINSTIN